MGWFDKKSWQKRRKIKDLQADLVRAEREGQYVVEQGLFFAELQDMGEATMMLFGASKELSGSEEGVIRSFFDRNGFIVETLKLDRNHSGLAEVEIIPPEEVTRWVGRIMKAEGFRLIDDSEEERPAELDRQILPLSSLVRGLIILFCERVLQIITTTGIKMNKEGNRLLHWMPQIAACLQEKTSAEAVEVLRGAFNDSYEQFFLRIGKNQEVSPSAALRKLESTGDQSRIPSVPAASRTATPSVPGLNISSEPPPPVFKPFRGQAEGHVPTPPPGREPSVEGPSAPPPKSAAATSAPALSNAEVDKLRLELHTAEAMARIYRSLVGASSSRCIKNAEAILEEVKTLFSATATCVMVKLPGGTGLTIHAQAGKRLIWGEGGEGYPVSSSILGNCIRQRSAVTSAESGGDPTASMIIHQIDSVAAIPIITGEEIVGILYLDRRSGVRPFTQTECDHARRIASVLGEFPDLTLGLIS